MLLEDVKLTFVYEWSEVAKNKKSKPVVHRNEVGSLKVDYGVSTEALSKLIDVLHDDVFEHDMVKIEISCNSTNY